MSGKGPLLHKTRASSPNPLRFPSPSEIRKEQYSDYPQNFFRDQFEQYKKELKDLFDENKEGLISRDEFINRINDIKDRTTKLSTVARKPPNLLKQTTVSGMQSKINELADEVTKKAQNYYEQKEKIQKEKEKKREEIDYARTIKKQEKDAEDFLKQKEQEYEKKGFTRAQSRQRAHIDLQKEDARRSESARLESVMRAKKRSEEELRHLERNPRKRTELKIPDVMKAHETEHQSTHITPAYQQEYNIGAIKGVQELINQGYQPYLKPRFADFNERQLNAMGKHEEMNPFEGPQYNLHQEQIRNAKMLPKDVMSKAALEEYKKHDMPFHEFHEKIMGPTENAYLNTLEKRLQRQYKNQLTPILGRFQKFGHRASGPMQEQLANFARAYAEGTGNVLSEAALKSRAATMPHAMSFLNAQYGKAQQRAEQAGQDWQNQVRAMNEVQNANHHFNQDRERYMAHEMAHGSMEQKLLQNKLNEEKQAFNEERNFYPEMINFGANIAKGQVAPSMVQKNEALQPPAYNSPFTDLGGGLSGAGAQMLMDKFKDQNNQNKKVGGKVYAQGGSVMDQAMQNAVLDETTPLNALNHLEKHNYRSALLNQALGRSRQHYAMGGSVNPIQQGINDAEGFIKERRNKMFERYAREQQPRDSGNAGIFEAFVRGASGDSWLGKAMQGAGKGIDIHHRNYEAEQNRQKSAFEKEEALLGEMAKEDVSERHFKEQMKQHALDRAMHEAHHKQMYDAQMAKYKDEQMFEDPNDTPTGKQTADNRKVVNDSIRRAEIVEKYADTIGKLNNLMDKISIGPNTERSLNWAGTTLTAGMKSLRGDKSKDVDYKEFETLLNQLIDLESKIDHVPGAGPRTNKAIELMLAGKLKPGLGNEKFKEGLNSKMEHANTVLEDLSNVIKRNKGSRNEIDRPFANVSKKEKSEIKEPEAEQLNEYDRLIKKRNELRSDLGYKDDLK